MNATTLRITASAIVIWIWVLLRGQGIQVLKGFSDRKAIYRLWAATLCGPVVGMIFYVTAFKTTAAGIVSLMSSLSPILIIPVTSWRYKVPINYPSLFSMVLALTGILLVILR